jgi:hypothetical protein
MKPSLALTAAAILGLVACVGDGDATILILQNQAPSEGCVIPATPSDSYIGAGRIDVSLGVDEGYLLTPVAVNQAETVDGNTIDRTAFVEGIQVDLEFPNDPDLESEFAGDNLIRFEIPYSAPISPGGGTTSFIAEIVPDQLLEELVDDVPDDGDSILIIAHVRLVGQLGDGGGFESASFQFPVEVCNGCLIRDLGSCGAIPTDYTIATGGACNIVQDFALDCCTSVGGDTFCPAVRETAAAPL